MNDIVKMGKCGCISTGIWLVQGDTRSHVLTIRVPRMESGVDLKDLAWKINITNEAGVDDVDVPVMGSLVVDERTIAFNWLIHGVATAVPGKTIFSVEGVDETEDGKPIIWRSSPATIYIRENHDATPSDEVEAELGELQKMIVYVNGELTNVIAAGEMARSAATHQPIIGENGNWFLWDLEKEEYVNSGVSARGSESLFVINLRGEPLVSSPEIIVRKHDYTYAEVQKAIKDGKVLLLRDIDGKVYEYSHTESVANSNDAILFRAIGQYIPNKGLIYNAIVIRTDYSAGVQYYGEKGAPIKTPNPKKLIFTDEDGETVAEYDGSEELKIPKNTGGGAERFIVTAQYNVDKNDGIDHLVIDKTPGEILTAHNVGMIVAIKFTEIKVNQIYWREFNFNNYIPLVSVYYHDNQNFELQFNGVLNGDRMTRVYIRVEAGEESRYFTQTEIARRGEIPTYLPNPWALTFEGGTYGTYKGNEGDPTTIHVPGTWRDIGEKPFGIIGDGRVVLPETEISLDKDGVGIIQKEFALYPDETYVVTINKDIVYECVAKRVGYSGSGYVAIGNIYSDAASEYPFSIFYHESGVVIRAMLWGGVVAPTFANQTGTIKIESKRVVVPVPTELINYSAQNKGKLLYVKDDGTLEPLTLGSGLEIRNGVLTLTGVVTPGELVSVSVDENGNATISGATLEVDADGNGTITGATVTVDENGNGNIS